MAIEGEGLTTQPEATVSLREQLAENLVSHPDVSESALGGQDFLSTPSQEGPAGEQAQTPETAEQKAGRTAGRERDAQGRLLPGKPAAAAQTQPAAALPGETATTAAATAAAPAYKRPTTWRNEAAAVLDKALAGQALTAAEAKIFHAEVEKREGDFANGISTYKREWDTAKPLIDAITPFLPQLQQAGIQPAQFISNMANTHSRLVSSSPQEKVGMFQQLLGSYGVPAQLAVQDAQGQWQLLGTAPVQQQAAQPQVSQQDITRLVQQELSNVTTQQMIATFEAEASTKYPHYATVKPEMAGLLQAGLAADLPSAYEAALRLPKHADIFAQMQQQQTEAKAADELAKRRATVARARSNAVSTVSSTPSSNMAASGAKGLRSMLEENTRAIGDGRV